MTTVLDSSPSSPSHDTSSHPHRIIQSDEHESLELQQQEEMMTSAARHGSPQLTDTAPLTAQRAQPYSNLYEESDEINSPHQHQAIVMALPNQNLPSVSPASSLESQRAKASRCRLFGIIGVVSLVLIAIIIFFIVRRATTDNDDSEVDQRIAGGGQTPRAPDDPIPTHTADSSDALYTVTLNIPPRLQWNENYGYCGSTSLICACLYYGEYISQYDNRNIASNNTNQKYSTSQLLLGVNDYWSAHQHKLTNELYPVANTNLQSFLIWIKQHVAKGHPVIIGVYENASVFGAGANDPDYDHIVIVTGFASNTSLTDNVYRSEDIIYFSDNGLFTPSGNTPIYHMSSRIGSIGNTRKGANLASSPVYSVRSNPTLDEPNYGIAITGVVDIHGDLLPTRIDTNLNYEWPEIQDGTNTRPLPMPLTLTVIASHLQVNQTYNMYQYNTMTAVPSSQFNANSANAIQTWNFVANQTTWNTTVNILSSDRAIFRTVLASAP